MPELYRIPLPELYVRGSAFNDYVEFVVTAFDAVTAVILVALLANPLLETSRCE